ncbi:MAG: patatin family protein, partial [Lachnospiraceae bacterium]|nr:patatin family protein [Lachnospiraceae bacterium]
IAHEPYLDGGCAVKIPYAYARSHFPGKTVVVRTQDLSYRRKPKKFREIDHLLYDRYPAFLNTLAKSHDLYNQTIEKMNRDVVYGETFVLAPNTPVTISRFGGNMEKLGDLYLRGYQETKEKIPALLAYLRA